MKKILLGLVMLLTAATMSAQIELELVLDAYMPTFKSANNVSRADWYYDRYNMDELYMLYSLNNTDDYNEQYDLYKIDGSFYKSVKVMSAYGAPIMTARNIFTEDDRICILYFFAMYEQGVRTAKFTIADENGEVLNEITNPSGAFSFQEVSKGCYKLLIGTADGNTQVYSCPGNGEATTSVENVSAKVKRNAYPNPASDLVILPYEVDGATSMKIYDMQGKLVERRFLDKNKQELQLNVKNYPSGMYFFEVNGESNSFIVD